MKLIDYIDKLEPKPKPTPEQQARIAKIAEAIRKLCPEPLPWLEPLKTGRKLERLNFQVLKHRGITKGLK